MKKIGEFAEQMNRSPRALRLYEERGLLTPEQRSAGGFRLYGPDQELRVRYIDKLQALGCSLSDIQTLIESWRAQPSAHQGMRALEMAYREKLRDVRAAIEKLQRVELELTESVDFLEGCHDCAEEVAAHEACHQCVRSAHQPLTLIQGLALTSHESLTTPSKNSARDYAQDHAQDHTEDHP